jgi:hypothetical protein
MLLINPIVHCLYLANMPNKMVINSSSVPQTEEE